jgi:catechol 2,3-dioxygenase-like lactoylglutathione lyase family enzyme
VTLGARDLPRLRDFYRGLGWEQVVDLEDFAAFQMRGALLTLFPLDRLADDARAEAAAPPSGLRGFTLAMVVDQPEEVDATIEAARAAGARIAKEPVDATEFEGRSAYFADPEDNFWEVVRVDPDGPMARAAARASSHRASTASEGSTPGSR